MLVVRLVRILFIHAQPREPLVHGNEAVIVDIEGLEHFNQVVRVVPGIRIIVLSHSLLYTVYCSAKPIDRPKSFDAYSTAGFDPTHTHTTHTHTHAHTHTHTRTRTYTHTHMHMQKEREREGKKERERGRERESQRQSIGAQA